MAEESFQEKTEQATPKRKEEAREKGQVARTTQLSSVAVPGPYYGWMRSLFLRRLWIKRTSPLPIPSSFAISPTFMPASLYS